MPPEGNPNKEIYPMRKSKFCLNFLYSVLVEFRLNYYCYCGIEIDVMHRQGNIRIILSFLRLKFSYKIASGYILHCVIYQYN